MICPNDVRRGVVSPALLKTLVLGAIIPVTEHVHGCGTGRGNRAPTGDAWDDDNSVDVIGHNNEFIDINPGVTLRQFVPHPLNDLPSIV